MTLVCIQCSMKAMVSGEPPPVFNESVEEHQRRVHPDLVATQRERKELEQRLTEKMNETHCDKDRRGPTAQGD